MQGPAAFVGKGTASAASSAQATLQLQRTWGMLTAVTALVSPNPAAKEEPL
jgi:hypothetical protein